MQGIQRFNSLLAAIRAGYEVYDLDYTDSDGVHCIQVRTRTAKGLALALCYPQSGESCLH